MNEAKQAFCEFCKQITKGVFQSATEMSRMFTITKKVILDLLVKCCYQLSEDIDRNSKVYYVIKIQLIFCFEVR